MNKILITGGAGFIGASVASAFVGAGHEVHLLDNFDRGQDDAYLQDLCGHDSVTLWTDNLLAADALESLPDDYTHVLHFAAILGVQNVLERPYDTLHDNTIMLAKVVDFARRQRALERFIFTSTSEVYAGSLLYLTDFPVPTPESTPIALTPLDQPRTSYMLSKLYGEAMVRHSGLPYTIVRPHNVYGPRMGMDHVVPQLLEKAHRAPENGSIEVFSVDHKRAFCYIDDAVEMILSITFSDACRGVVLNLGNQSQEVAIGDAAAVIIEVVGKTLSIDACPATPGSPARRAPHMGQMSELTGFEARVDLKDGVRKTYAWYRKHVFEADQGS